MALRAAGTAPICVDAVFADVWARVWVVVDGDATDLREDELDVASLDQARAWVVLDRSRSARRRKRANWLATAALAVAVAGGGTLAAA